MFTKYLKSFTDPSILIKKLGVLGLLVIVPLLVLRLIVSLIMGSWTEFLISVSMILSLATAWDFLSFASKGSKNKEESKPKTSTSSKKTPEDIVKEAMLNKLNK